VLAAAERAAAGRRARAGLAVGAAVQRHRRRVPRCAPFRLRVRVRAAVRALRLVHGARPGGRRRDARGRPGPVARPRLAQLVRTGPAPAAGRAAARAPAPAASTHQRARAMTLSSRLAAVAILSLLLAACAGGPGERGPAPLTGASPLQMAAAIEAAAGEGELTVMPLRDPMVEDLREQARAARAAGDYDAAAAALDRALDITPDDPALLQERAEAALLQRDFEHAGALAERAFALGAQV